jgi:hypothetical protein
VQHDYYQIILLPIMSIYVAKGFVLLVTEKYFIVLPGIHYWLSACFYAHIFVVYHTYYWINRPE